MHNTFYIIQKEFKQIFRNRIMIPVIFLLPFVQLIILVHAATLDMKNVRFIMVDNDCSTLSEKLGSRFSNNSFFTPVKYTWSVSEAEADLLHNKTDMILVIPKGFGQLLVRGEGAEVQVLIDAVNGLTAGLINGYALQVIAEYNLEVLTEKGEMVRSHFTPKNINIEYSFWYNPELEFKYYMVPGILAILLTVIGMFLTSLNLVREKEMGNIEQINVTPIRKVEFLTGKLVPFWIIAMFELALGLLIGKMMFDIPMEGSLMLLFGYAALYMAAMLGIGLLISTMSQTQQQAQFLNFFVLVTLIMLSGIFTPEESLPDWAKDINLMNPIAYFIRVNRMILLKGSGISDIKADLLIMFVMAVVFIALANWRYRKIA
ncbi:MAG: ABC transporter permease [Bacteroidales bacterium]|nr:ABC transporter permease [Bacteroidales bacterium]